MRLSDGLVHFEIEGSTDAQTVVLIPGFSVPYFVWDPTFIAFVEAGFRVLRYDLYGRGYSDRPETSYNQELFDRQLWELLEVLGITQRVDLVGLSLGGPIALVFTDRHPTSVRKLCLIDPAGLPWDQPATATLTKIPLLGELIMTTLGDRVLVSRLRDYFHGQEGYLEFAERFRGQMEFAGFKRALLSTIRNGVTTGATEAYERVGRMGIPTILVWGREDRVVPFELHHQVREMMPKVEFHAIDAAAHIPHYERPDVVNPLLIEFLSR